MSTISGKENRLEASTVISRAYTVEIKHKIEK
jgi:hypothetical protein